MTRLGTFATSTVVAALLSVVPDASGQVRSVLPRGHEQLRPIAAVLAGSVEGTVIDDAGVAVAGATVSALGATSALAVSDRTGHFHLSGLPAGQYMVRAHYTGYIPSRRQIIEVRPSGRTTVAMSLRRTTKVLTAGFGSTSGGDTQATDDHSDVAWYLRHAPRSVLKDVTAGEAVAGGDEKSPEKGSGVGHTAASPMRFASNLFDGLPLTGQVNLLTASSFDTVDQLFSSETLSRSVASLSLAGPMGAWGDWAIQGITTQGDLGTWFLAGTFKSHAPVAHVYQVNVEYAAQRFTPPAAEFARTDSGDTRDRAVGSVFAVDRWQVSPQLALTYGARYSRYDYLNSPGLFSPRAEVAVKPVAGLQIRGSLSRTALVPGAEEFLPPLAAGVWVPSERTFNWISTLPVTPECTNNYELVVERQLPEGYAVAARTFYQEVTNQLVALFGSASGSSTLPGTLYHVGTIGDVDARGWSVSLSNSANRHVRGSITYQMTTAAWPDFSNPAIMGLVASSMADARAVRIHDLTTSVEAEMPRTETRVFVLYKFDTAFGRGGNEARPGLDGRFDVQVTQPLPLLDFTAAQWQFVFAVRNMFREMTPGGSVYDELLVVQPPKRVVGGLMVRF